MISPEDSGSIIAMTFNERGDIIASRERGPLVRIFDEDRNGIVETVETFCEDMENCQGILALNGDVFAVGDGPDGTGLYRLSDEDGDRKAESVTQLLKFSGGVGEHGPHAPVLGPDGLIYIVLGNHTFVEGDIQAGIARETVDILEEMLRIANVKHENGMASAQDVSLARSDLASAREGLTTVEGSQRDAIRALEALLGRYPGADLEVRKSLPDVPPAPPAGLPSELLERRPDIVAAERRVAAAFNVTNQARAARLPTIGLTGSVGGASDSLSDLLDPGNVAWSVGANLLAPIFDGGRRREAVEIATADQDAALAAYGNAAIGAFSELETNLDQGVVVERRIVDLKEAAAEAENAFRIAKLRYDEGEEELLNVLTIQQRVIGSRSSLSSVERLLLEQRVNLNLALGGSWDE